MGLGGGEFCGSGGGDAGEKVGGDAGEKGGGGNCGVESRGRTGSTRHLGLFVLSCKLKKICVTTRWAQVFLPTRHRVLNWMTVATKITP